MIIGRDVTERRRGESERLRLEQAMDQASDAIVMWGLDGAHHLRERRLGAAHRQDRRSEALGGRRSSQVTKPIPGSRPMGEIIRESAEGRTWSGRLPMYGGGFLDATITPVRDAAEPRRRTSSP